MVQRRTSLAGWGRLIPLSLFRQTTDQTASPGAIVNLFVLVVIVSSWQASFAVWTACAWLVACHSMGVGHHFISHRLGFAANSMQHLLWPKSLTGSYHLPTIFLESALIHFLFRFKNPCLSRRTVQLTLGLLTVSLQKCSDDPPRIV